MWCFRIHIHSLCPVSGVELRQLNPHSITILHSHTGQQQATAKQQE
jgi:hypothetical protein